MNRSISGKSLINYAFLMAVCACTAAAAGAVDARRGDQVDDYFGQKVADPYRWMEDIDSPETGTWIAAERANTAAALEKIPERGPIGARLKALWNFPKFGLPQKRQGRMFYTKNDGLQNQAVLYVIDAQGSAPRVLIDPNTLSSEGTVAVTQITPTMTGSSSATGSRLRARTGTSSTCGTWRPARTCPTSSAG
jgi:protease II